MINFITGIIKDDRMGAIEINGELSTSKVTKITAF